MNALTCDQIAALALSKLGLHVSGAVSDGQMSLWPSAHHPNEAFRVLFKPRWRSAEATLSPGTFAGTMVRAMAAASDNAKLLFRSYVSSFRNEGAQVSMQINGLPVDPGDPDSWPVEWGSFEVSAQKSALVFDLNKDSELVPVADILVMPLLAMAIALVGTEEEDAVEGVAEGAAVQYLATRYERRKLNRDACIRIHGTVCAGCGFSFGKFYGDLAEGYIEVHHIEPLALSGEVVIDPETDLVPLCSNCHSVVHRLSPPMPIDHLRAMIAKRRSE